MQDIRQAACYDSETDQMLIPFEDSYVLFNPIFQECVSFVFYRNISETTSYSHRNQIDKNINFWGPSRIDVTVIYQDKNTDEPQAQTSHLALSPEQVKTCSFSSKSKSNLSPALFIICIFAGICIIIIFMIVIFITRKKAKKQSHEEQMSPLDNGTNSTNTIFEKN